MNINMPTKMMQKNLHYHQENSFGDILQQGGSRTMSLAWFRDHILLQSL